jgi:hypothetical protein
MRLAILHAWVFWTQWIWREAWVPSMRAVRQSSLLTWAIVMACVIALSATLAFEGHDKAEDQLKWFLWNNVVGAVVIFIAMFIFNFFLAPGHLLARDITRELVGGWLIIINDKTTEAATLIEAIRLGQDIATARQDFDRWRESTRRFFAENLPLYEPIFDDIECGPFGALLDLPARLRASSPLGFQNYMAAQPENPGEALIDMISRRRANLRRIYENLLPTSVSGNVR